MKEFLCRIGLHNWKHGHIWCKMVTLPREKAEHHYGRQCKWCEKTQYGHWYFTLHKWETVTEYEFI